MEYFKRVPMELFLEIVGYLAPRDLFRLAMAKKGFHRVLQDVLDRHKLLYKKHGLLVLGNNNLSWICLDTITQDPSIVTYMESCQITSVQSGYLNDKGIKELPDVEDANRWTSLVLQSPLLQSMDFPVDSPASSAFELKDCIENGHQGPILARVLTIAVNIRRLDLILSPYIAEFLCDFLARLSEEYLNHRRILRSFELPFQHLEQVSILYKNQRDDTRISWLYLFKRIPSLKRLAARCIGQNLERGHDHGLAAITGESSQKHVEKANIEQLILIFCSGEVLGKLYILLEQINGLKTFYMQQSREPSPSETFTIESLTRALADYHSETLQILWLANDSTRAIFEHVGKETMNDMTNHRGLWPPLFFNRLRLLYCDWSIVLNPSYCNIFFLVESLEVLILEACPTDTADDQYFVEKVMEPLCNLKALRATSWHDEKGDTPFMLMMKAFAIDKGLKWLTEKDCWTLEQSIRKFSDQLDMEDLLEANVEQQVEDVRQEGELAEGMESSSESDS